MGLSSLPAPSEGMLCILLVNTALSISMVKGLVRSILHVVGGRISSSPASLRQPEHQTSNAFELRLTPSDSFIEEFRSRTPTILYNTVCGRQPSEDDCRVCLMKFEPGSEVNTLNCGHLFHKVCLQRWVDYWNITCPLCRTPMLPEEEPSSRLC